MRRLFGYGALVAVVLTAVVAGTEGYVRSLAPHAKRRVIRALSDRFDAEVTLADLSLSLFPSPSVTGRELRVRHRNWSDADPLLTVSRFTADSTFFNLFFQRDRVRTLRLELLKIHVPHRGKSAARAAPEYDEQVASGEPGHDRTRLAIGIGSIIADGTLLEIEPKDPTKDPLRFEIAKLTLHSVQRAEPMTFDATLTNPKPPGQIITRGQFGPWQKDDPRATAVSGDYEFKNADLSVFKGISGILSSTGTYDGVLQHIEVKGQTDTPDFALKRGRSTVQLTTTFQSTVNGMNGDTILDRVEAHLLKSAFICKGTITREENHKGKKVKLRAYTKGPARMEDILQLVTGDKVPLMTGDVRFRTTIVIPPGDRDVIDKLQLDGDFQVSSARFSNANINEKLLILSERARGISKAEQDRYPQTPVASDLFARFKLQNGTMNFGSLSFAIPGALVKLNGDLHLISHQIEMAGLFRMQSTLSDTQSGIKHWLLKPLDPVFRRDGAGLEVPLKVGGTQDHPTLSVSAFHHTFRVK